MELYPFIMTVDILESEDYHIADLQKANHALDNFAVALKIAMRIAS